MVLDRSTRLRMRRMFRRHQRQVEQATSLAETNFDRNFIARLERLLDVQRFVVGWIFLVVALASLTVLQTVGLNQYYRKLGPVSGGTLNEGMVGTFNNANPIYVSGLVDTSLSRLIFAGLFKYDNSNQLIGDLASTYSVDDSGKVYTVTLKPNLQWHDGTPLTSRDVLFTYATIQNPDARSPLFHGWQGISISTPDDRRIVFRLSSALTAFPYGLTTGIIPQHILGKVPAAQLRAHPFNTTEPVGAGPFKWDTLQLGSALTNGSTTISLKAFEAYNGGRPNMDGLILHTYEDEDQLIAAYRKRSIEAMAGLKQLPEELRRDRTAMVLGFPTSAATMIFFKTSEGILSDKALRQALVLATDRNAVISNLGDGVRPVRAPVLKGQFVYDKAYEQAPYNPAAAAAALDQAGWVRGKSGTRVKNNQTLTVQIVAEDTPDNHRVLESIRQDWKEVGAVLNPVYQPKADFQSTVETHSYAALLYGISIGPDPDVFVYWDSTQTDPRSPNRLNFSEYKSSVADTALESGRTRQDTAVRILKYKPFLKAWQEDAPAIGLYQPSSLYVTRGTISGLIEHTLNTDADRYYSIVDWAIKTGHVDK
ncbi:peptide ABC transporter substrate-binding protein [Candidatus Saccharibacteria bacterium]|nr:peptide ABC transporter substrate-binding protein [Candidatus Saccharibacteria bacterium]